MGRRLVSVSVGPPGGGTALPSFIVPSTTLLKKIAMQTLRHIVRFLTLFPFVLLTAQQRGAR